MNRVDNFNGRFDARYLVRVYIVGFVNVPS
jgi:hypothetical protein